MTVQKFKKDETIVDIKLRDSLIETRLVELRGFAADDEIVVNEESVTDFLSIFKGNDDFALPAIFLEDNGDVSATWQDTKRLSVIFLGGSETKTIKYSSFNKKDLPMPHIGTPPLQTAVAVIRNYFDLKNEFTNVLDVVK